MGLADVYWELVLKDGRTIQIKPASVAAVRQRWQANQVINFQSESINPYDVKTLRATSRVYSEVPLIEAAAAAFDEPIIGDTGEVAGRWVKKEVSPSDYANHYGKIPAYRRLSSDSSGMVTVAFVLPIHEIKGDQLAYCTDDEIKSL